MIRRSAFADVAARLVERGYSSVPIAPGTKSPGIIRRGEWQPMPEWTRYADRLPSRFELSVWFTYPDAGIGAVSGPASGHLVGIDIDSDDPAIRAAILSALPPTEVIKRGAKGETRFFRGPNIARSKSWRLYGTEQVADLIGPGRQTVLPPSIHMTTGQPYRWIGARTLEDLRPGQLPELTLQHIAAIDDALRPFGYREPVLLNERSPSVFECSDARGREYGLSALYGCADELASTCAGSRNNTLNAIAYKLGRYVARRWLSEDEIALKLWNACVANGLIADDGEHAFRSTLKSGLAAGLQKPAPDPRERLTHDAAFAARIKLTPRAPLSENAES